MYRSHRTPTQRSAAGFTLIEMMITVAIVAILASIALPAYTNQIRKSRRGDAKIALLDLAARQERFNTLNFRYATTLSELGFTVTPPLNTISVPSAANAYYAVSFTLTTTGFNAIAAPQGDQGNDGCKTFTLDDRGTQGLQGSPTLSVPDCWK